MATLVKFRLNHNEDGVYAFFPQLNYNKYLYGNALKTCYEHIGQHHSCHVNYEKKSKKASPEQYNDLKKELENIGYVLRIVQQKRTN